MAKRGDYCGRGGTDAANTDQSAVDFDGGRSIGRARPPLMRPPAVRPSPREVRDDRFIGCDGGGCPRPAGAHSRRLRPWRGGDAFSVQEIPDWTGNRPGHLPDPAYDCIAVCRNPALPALT